MVACWYPDTLVTHTKRNLMEELCPRVAMTNTLSNWGSSVAILSPSAFYLFIYLSQEGVVGFWKYFQLIVGFWKCFQSISHVKEHELEYDNAADEENSSYGGRGRFTSRSGHTVLQMLSIDFSCLKPWHWGKSRENRLLWHKFCRGSYNMGFCIFSADIFHKKTLNLPPIAMVNKKILLI